MLVTCRDSHSGLCALDSGCPDSNETVHPGEEGVGEDSPGQAPSSPRPRRWPRLRPQAVVTKHGTTRACPERHLGRNSCSVLVAGRGLLLRTAASLGVCGLRAGAPPRTQGPGSAGRSVCPRRWQVGTDKEGHLELWQDGGGAACTMLSPQLGGSFAGDVPGPGHGKYPVVCGVVRAFLGWGEGPLLPLP